MLDLIGFFLQDFKVDTVLDELLDSSVWSLIDPVGVNALCSKVFVHLQVKLEHGVLDTYRDPI